MKKRLLRYLLQVTGKRKKNIVLLALLQIALGGSSVLNALALKEILNAAVKGDRTVFGVPYVGLHAYYAFRLHFVWLEK